ncbi:RibD family protein [Nitrosomonas sp.]|uniref:RibD family protein n=2 Tax=Nitrosomonas sp. TaxID=42353 RepID=UPI0037C8373D
MDEPIIRLYPQPGGEQSLKGTYLAHNLRQHASEDQAFVYTNFVVSLDGRIALPRGETQGMNVPRSIANNRDWRLFQELAAQADLIIISSDYIHNWAQGKAPEILQVDEPQFADLGDWRRACGLSPQADVAIISKNLRFSIPDVLTAGGRKVIVFTTADPDPVCVREIEKHAVRIIIAGDRKSVNGTTMVDYMTDLGYRTIFSSAGPQILYLLLTSNVLNRLYMTQACRILGGNSYASLVEGELLKPAVDLTLNSLYLDPPGQDGLSQLFIAYDRP